MNISLQFGAEDAVTEDEKSRVWDRSPHAGTFFNNYFIQSDPTRLGDGKYDFTETYVNAMRELAAMEPRFVAGRHFCMSISS